jgi:KRAB domain-containing zinc finger protein
MKSETFVNGNKKITYSEGFAEFYKFADNDFNIPDERICEICIVQLENAYLFWSFCRVTTAILHRKYSKAVVMVKIDDKNESSSLSDDDNVNESSNEPTNNQQSTSRPGIGSDDYTCNKSFSTKWSLKMHRRNVRCVENIELNQTIKPYKCKRCNTGFTKNSKLRRHIINSIRCMNANSKNLTINVDTSSSNIRQPAEDNHLTCKNCKKTFKRMSHLRRHNLEVRCKKNTFLSSNNITESDSHLEESKITQTSNQSNSSKVIVDKPFKCDICNEKFTNIFNIRRHIRQVHVLNKKYKCSLCSTGFTIQTNLGRHTKKKHPHAIEKQKDIHKQYKCFLCPTGFSRLSSLFRHNRTKHQLVKEQCEFCKQVFSSRRSLEDHDRTVHLIDGYKCELCLKVFKQKSTIFHHKRKVHPNACKICKMEFNSSTDLIVHNETHPKIHECSECEQSFTHLKDLNAHTRSTHFANIHFTCDICGKILQSPATFKRHMLHFHLNV